MKPKTYYSVIRILSDKKILIDYGSEQGARLGGRVRVIRKGPEIIHPTRNVSLGTLDTILASLEIIEVYENFSVCADVRITETNILNPLQVYVKKKREFANLSVNAEQIEKVENLEHGEINVGDDVEILSRY